MKEYRLGAAKKDRQTSRSEWNPGTFARQTLIAVGITAAVVIALSLMVIAPDVFLLVFSGILLAVLLRSLSDWIAAHTPLSEKGSLAAVIFLLIALFGLIGWSLAPEISKQFSQLIQNLPKMAGQLNQRLSAYGLGRPFLTLKPTAPGELAGSSGLISRLAGLFSTTFGILGSIAIVLFIGIHMAIDPASYRSGVVRIFPFAKRERIGEVLDQIGMTLRWWLIARMIAMVVIGVLTTAGLLFRGIQPALALGVAAGILNFIPYLGPLLSVVPALLIALGHGTHSLIYVALLYLVVQWIDNYFVTPTVEKRAVQLPPALTVTVQLLLGVLIGALGVMLASPLTASLMVIIKLLYIEDTLGDRVKEV
jgi:predicted PurR-regulated permease PerM